MKQCYEYTDIDRLFYKQFIKDRLPDKVYDIHVHLNLPEHIEKVPPSRWETDWALECGHLLSYDEAGNMVKEIFPDTHYKFGGFPWPIREADLKSNNEYLGKLNNSGLLNSFMCVRPDWPLMDIEKSLLEGNFVRIQTISRHGQR